MEAAVPQNCPTSANRDNSAHLTPPPPPGCSDQKLYSHVIKEKYQLIFESEYYTLILNNNTS